MATQLTTYESTATNKRDVNDFVVNISPSDSPMYSMIAETGMTSRKKENVYDTYGGGSSINSLAEGDTFTDQTITARSVSENYAQIFYKVINISDTQEEVAKYGGVKSEVEYQVKKKFVELAKDVEYSFMIGTATAGVTGTGTANARKLGGLLTKITTNTATASGDASTGTAFEDELNDLFETMYGTGETPDTVLCAGARKRYISALTTNVTRNVDAEKKMQINSINVYDSDFGTVNIILDRYVPATSLFANQEGNVQNSVSTKI